MKKTNPHVSYVHFSTARADETKSISTYLFNEIKATLDTKSPAILNFQVSTGETLTTRISKINRVLDINIPLIPVCYNLVDSKEINNFFKTGTPDKIASKTNAMTSEEIDKRCEKYTNRVLNLVYFSLARVYVQSLHTNDQKRLDVIRNLDMMQGFDFKSLETLVEAGFILLTDDKGRYYINKNHKSVELSASEYNKLNKMLNLLKKAKEDETKFGQITQKLEEFNPYTIMR